MRLWALVVACLAAACSGGGGDGDRPSASAARPGEVRIAVGEDIWPLTGSGASSKHFAAGELNVGVYEPLVSLAPDFTARPGLAERWEMTAPDVWRFHLRPGVRFHDGRPFTADDVVWSWGRDFLPGSVRDTLRTVARVDELVVDFVLSAPNLRLPEQLVHPEGPIVPNGSHNDADPPVGTGPFTVVEYEPRRHVVVERFDGYWGTKPRAQRLTFRFMPDASDRLQALREGDVDMVTGLPRDEVAAVDADPGLSVVRAPLGATQILSFNTASAFGADPVVRRAVSLAVDRDRYVADVLGGNGDPGRWISPPAVLGAAAPAVELSRFDPAEARSILEAAGWARGPDGTRTSGVRRLDLVLIGGQAVPEEGLRLVAAQLAEVGIQATVKKAFDIRTAQENRQKPHDVELAVPNQNDANPAFLLASRTVADEEYAALAGQAATAGTRQDVQRAAAAMTRILVNREHLVVPLAGVFHVYGMREGVTLAEAHPSAVNQTWVTLTPAA